MFITTYLAFEPGMWNGLVAKQTHNLPRHPTNDEDIDNYASVHIQNRHCSDIKIGEINVRILQLKNKNM